MGEILEKRYARESFVTALCAHEILAPFCYQGTCNTALFNMWVESRAGLEAWPGRGHGQCHFS